MTSSLSFVGLSWSGITDKLAIKLAKFRSSSLLQYGPNCEEILDFI